MTRQQFLTAYRAQLCADYPWTADAAKLEKFMLSVENTLKGPTATWIHDGKSVTAAWRAIGGKGKPTLKALRELPARVTAKAPELAMPYGEHAAEVLAVTKRMVGDRDD